MESNMEKGLQQAQQPQPEYIMLCLPSQHHPNSWALHQLTVQNPPATSADFFKRLRKEYFAKRARGPLGIPRFWLRIAKIHYVRFELHSGAVHVEDWRDRPHDVEGWVCPPLHERGRAKGYPPPDVMAEMFYHPERADSGFAYEFVPRKLDPMAAGEWQVGWGLCFEEERRVRLRRSRRWREWLLFLVMSEVVFMDGMLVGLRSGGFKPGYWDVVVVMVAMAVGIVAMDKAWESSS